MTCGYRRSVAIRRVESKRLRDIDIRMGLAQDRVYCRTEET
jgi:hypothetical protein